MIGIRSAFSIRARGHRPHLEAVYMNAPRSVCRNTKKALPTGGRPYMTIERPCAPSASLRAQAKQSIQAQKEDGIASWFSLQCANASPFVAGNDLARVVPAKAGTHNHRCSRLDDSDAVS